MCHTSSSLVRSPRVLSPWPCGRVNVRGRGSRLAPRPSPQHITRLTSWYLFKYHIQMPYSPKSAQTTQKCILYVLILGEEKSCCQHTTFKIPSVNIIFKKSVRVDKTLSAARKNPKEDASAMVGSPSSPEDAISTTAVAAVMSTAHATTIVMWMPSNNLK